MSDPNDPKVLVEHIDSFGESLTSWEIGFIGSLIDDPPDEYSEKQIANIKQIYDEKC